jgi:hypothetical protein
MASQELRKYLPLYRRTAAHVHPTLTPAHRPLCCSSSPAAPRSAFSSYPSTSIFMTSIASTPKSSANSVERHHRPQFGVFRSRLARILDDVVKAPWRRDRTTFHCGPHCGMYAYPPGRTAEAASWNTAHDLFGGCLNTRPQTDPGSHARRTARTGPQLAPTSQKGNGPFNQRPHSPQAGVIFEIEPVPAL